MSSRERVLCGALIGFVIGTAGLIAHVPAVVCIIAAVLVVSFLPGPGDTP